ncbi:MAG: membrane protein insertase YidC [Gammaproteobacteria bacterium]|nr:membrane protein insertase YidC [Gammaproteobacteria bacterium]
MENQKTLLYFTLFFLIYLLWAQWQMDYGPKPATPTVVENTENKTVIDSVDSNVPMAASTTGTSNVAAQPAQLISAQRIKVITDVLEIEIDTRGGDVRRATLRKYAIDAKKPEEKIVLLTDEEVDFHIAQSGLVSVNKETAPTHNDIYSAEQTTYRLAEGVNEIEVPLHWTGSDGTKVTKLYTFRRNDYAINVDHKVVAGRNGWSGSQYMQLFRSKPSDKGGSAFIYTYTGGVIFNDEIKYEKIDFDDLQEENLKKELDKGWLAMIQHYFLAAWIPEGEGKNLYFSRYTPQTEHYVLGVRSSAKRLMPNEQAEFNSRFVTGPKLQYKLEEVEPGLELTVDYGVLTIIAKPLFWLLNVFHTWFGNWGWAIIFLTLTVKGMFYKLSEMSYKSMAKMRKVAPRMKQMKEQYGDDRQAMSKAMMEMYKRENINPMGGCLPILVQIPVFISLYWVLLESVEMRQAPFALWLDNLSAKDPYFVLPVIMGISMYVQQKLNPAPIDPIQQKVFQYMPIAFTFMFAFFPSGLVLYWVVNNLLSILQQYVITKRIENAK